MIFVSFLIKQMARFRNSFFQNLKSLNSFDKKSLNLLAFYWSKSLAKPLATDEMSDGEMGLLGCK